MIHGKKEEYCKSKTVKYLNLNFADKSFPTKLQKLFMMIFLDTTKVSFFSLSCCASVYIVDLICSEYLEFHKMFDFFLSMNLKLSVNDGIFYYGEG